MPPINYCINIYSFFNGALLVCDTGVFSVINGCMYLATTAMIIFWLKRQEWMAQQGHHGAVASTIFPIFVSVLWCNAAVNAVVGLYLISDINGSIAHYVIAVLWGLQHAVIEGVALLLMQKGLGYHAARTAGIRAFLWGIFTSFVNAGVFLSFGKTASLVVLFFWECCLFFFYSLLWLVPMKYCYRRPAVLEYAKFWTIYRFITVIVYILILSPSTTGTGVCIDQAVVFFLFPIMEPWITYRAFLLDSSWWQGLSIPSHFKSQTEGAITSPLAGINVDLQSAQSLADTLDHMKGDQGVKLVNFAYLKLYSNALLGQGSFSKVYRGTYKRKSIAIKLIYSLDLTVDVISRVAAEAHILSSVQHPNIIRIYGVAVLPPSVCILLEICALGSLTDVLRGKKEKNNTQIHSTTDLAQLKLCFADLVYLAIGCARGLAKLHTLNEEMCHRDVKSMNFLVNEQLVAKVADLELGIVKDQLSAGEQEEEFLPNWAAPEVVVAGGRHTQASDVYSFALVMWEMISRKIPFADFRQADDIRAMIIKGYRPDLDIELPANTDPRFLSLIRNSWDNDVAKRPTMQDVVTELQDIWANVCANKVTSVKTDVDLSLLPTGSVNFSTACAAFNSADIPPAIHSVVLSMKHDTSWSELETSFASGSSWAVFSQKKPHWLLWHNAAWNTDFQLTAADVFNAGGFACLAAYPKDQVGIRQRVADFLHCFKMGRCGHTVLELRRRDGSTGLYSLHCFPVGSPSTSRPGSQRLDSATSSEQTFHSCDSDIVRNKPLSSGSSNSLWFSTPMRGKSFFGRLLSGGSRMAEFNDDDSIVESSAAEEDVRAVPYFAVLFSSLGDEARSKPSVVQRSRWSSFSPNTTISSVLSPGLSSNSVFSNSTDRTPTTSSDGITRLQGKERMSFAIEVGRTNSSGRTHSSNY